MTNAQITDCRPKTECLRRLISARHKVLRGIKVTPLVCELGVGLCSTLQYPAETERVTSLKIAAGGHVHQQTIDV